MRQRSLAASVLTAVGTIFSILVVSLAAHAHLGPDATATASDFLRANYPRVDVEDRIADVPLARALAYFEKHRDEFRNKTYIGVVDFTKRASVQRFFIVNIRTGAVESYAVAHGKGTDPAHTGIARTFSDRFGSQASSIGFYRTAETYHGKHGLSMRLDGLSPTNAHARARDIVIHSAWYVTPKQAFGRSNGCFAVSESMRDRILKRLGRGALIYAYGGKVARRG